MSLLKSFILWFIFFVVEKTCKWTIHDKHVLESLRKSKEPVLICIWHGIFIFPFIYLKKMSSNIHVVSSSHRDSQVLARVLKHHGFRLIKGSSSQGGVRVMKNIITLFKKSDSMVVVTNDGPKGPPRVAKPGSLSLANKLNAKIIFISGKSSSFWNLKTWDQFVLPKPFSTNHIYSYEILLKNCPESISLDEFVTNEMNMAQNKFDKRKS